MAYVLSAGHRPARSPMHARGDFAVGQEFAVGSSANTGLTSDVDLGVCGVEATDQHEAVGKFKHDVYAYALGEKGHLVYKTMYLYDGTTRMAKVSKSIDNHGDRLNMVFLDDAFAVYFDGRDELLSNRRDVWLKNRFEKNYVAVPTKSHKERKWLDLAR